MRLASAIPLPTIVAVATKRIGFSGILTSEVVVTEPPSRWVRIHSQWISTCRHDSRDDPAARP
jgi:hypothetical protein